MSTQVLDEFKSLVPASRRVSANGWNNFCCPACNDKRYRGGMNFTSTGGFRYYCFNGGCEFNLKPTGWEPDMGFGGRPRKLFEMLGGDIRNIPANEMLKWNRTRFNARGDIIGEDADLEVVNSFPEVDLPDDSMLLAEAAKKNKYALAVFDYILGRDPSRVREFTFMWSPKHRNYLIIPFFHYEKVVGFVGRNIYAKEGGERFIGYAPKDFMFNQDLLSRQSAKYVFVVESPIDAITLECLATRGDRLTTKQINLLKVSGKEPVLIPDLKKNEGDYFLELANENKWHMSCPDFGRPGVTDLGAIVKYLGLLRTIEIIVENITTNYESAKVKFRTRAVR